MPTKDLIETISTNCLHGRPLPNALCVLWDAFNDGDRFVTETCGLSLLKSLDALGRGYGPELEKESPAIAANIRAHRRLFTRLGFFAEDDDGGLLAIDLQGSASVHGAPVVELDSEGQYDWLGLNLAEAIYRRAERAKEGAVAEQWLNAHGLTFGRTGDLGSSTQFLPALGTLHERYYWEENGKPKPRLPDATGPALPDDPSTWLLRSGAEVRIAICTLLGLSPGQTPEAQWVSCDGEGRVATVWLRRSPATESLRVLGVGYDTPKTEVTAKLGQPSKKGDGWVRYDSPERDVHFEFHNGKVSRITLMTSSVLS